MAVTRLNRRNFLTLSSSSLLYLATAQSLSAKSPRFLHHVLQESLATVKSRSCWLDVCAPFVIQDPKLGIDSEIVLTSDNFIGATGYSDGADATEYEIYLYDSEGRLFGENGSARRLTVTAMQTTVLSVADIVGSDVSFWG